MAISRTLRITGGAAAALLMLTVPVHAGAPQATNGTYLEIVTETNGQVVVLKLSFGVDVMRMDIDQQGGMSIVSHGGDNAKILVMMHAQQQYMEVTPQMLAGMAGMMGQMPPQVENEIADATPPTFTRTGNTKQVGEWAAYEVEVEHPDRDDDVAMWFSQDVDADFRALAQQVIASTSSLLNSPMARMGGGGGGSNMFREIEAQLRAADIPDGFPVQIISADGGTPSITTLRAIDQDAAFDAGIWEAADGYSPMQMPFRR